MDENDTSHETGPIVEADLEDYTKITLPRRRLARWCNEPFFKKAVNECFVRVLIGVHDGKKCYRLCKIEDVKRGKKSYKFPATKGQKPITTNKILILSFGSKNIKEFPMYLISDSRPNEEDLVKYINVVKGARDKVLSKKKASNLRRSQDDLVNNYTYKNEDIELILKERKKMPGVPKNLGSEQTRAELAVQSAKSAIAEAQNRLEEAKLREMNGKNALEESELRKNVEKLDDELRDAERELEDRLSERKKIQESVNKRKEIFLKQQKNKSWAKVNQRARQMNENADFEAFKDQQARKDAEVKFNPYARRKVKPKVLWEVGQKEEKKDDDLNENVKSVDGNIEDLNGKRSKTVLQAAQAAQEAKKVALVAESHQISLDGDGEYPEDDGPGFGLTSKKRSFSRMRKGISLSEYLERKAAGIL
mmetsp:Transcript_10214/g.11385  ORF Transcript_10214/g.11385 Transcript_10214/m.11385 type:complete len:421 (-) Transcript_10214:312-1574(-)